MKVKAWIPLVVSVGLGLIALKLTRDAMLRGRGEKEDTGSVATVIAARDIAPGQRFVLGDVAAGKVAKESLPTGSFHSASDVLDRVAVAGLVKGQPVLESLLSPVGGASGVQALIPPGMRAITLQVNEFSGLAGLLVPGCRVDVISVITADDKRGPVARTIVQNVEVRAVGQQVSARAEPTPDAAPARSVTLLVTPAQAEAVQLSQVGGHPWLVLRNARDAAALDTGGTTFADLRGAKPGQEQVVPEVVATRPKPDPFVESKAPDAEPLKTRKVTFIRATKEESMQVDVPATPATAVTSTDAAEVAK